MVFQFHLPPLKNILLSLIKLLDKSSEECIDDDSASSESPPSPSLVQVPVHVATGLIKERLPVFKYSCFLKRSEARRENEISTCAVCLGLMNGGDEVRELCNCTHVFHRACLDDWIDQGQVTCPLCRSKLWPEQSNGKSKCGDGGDQWRRERMVYLFGDDFCFL